MKTTSWVCTLAALIPFALVALPEAQQPPPASQSKPTVQRGPVQPTTSVEGKDLFAAHCAVCHGKDAKGNGPAAAALKVAPPDLTTFAKRHDGKYDKTAVLAIIKGISKPAHGSSDMPIWGPVFQSFESSPAESSLRLANLVEYIGTLQQK